MGLVSRFTSHASRFTFFVLSCLLALLTVGWTSHPQEETLAVVGQVINGTPGALVPTGLEVTLHVFADAEEEVDTYTTTLAADGSFAFEGLAAVEGRTYVVQVTYQGVDYFSESGSPQAGQRELSLPVTIYETTEDPASIQVAQLHIFMVGMGDHMQVGEYYLVGNAGDRTYVGSEDPQTGERVTLRFTVPEGAEGLSFDGPGLGERFVEQEGGFADTEPVPPGTVSSAVLFHYELPYHEGLQVERVFEMPVASVVLVMGQGELAPEGPGLTPAGVVDTQMGPALSYTAGPLAVGEPLAFTLVPAPPPAPAAAVPSTTATPVRNPARETAVGLVALAAATVAIYLLWRPPAPGPVPVLIRPLVEEIAALDEEYEAGKVPERMYRKQREDLTRRARAALKRGGR